jgi:DNA-binding response OmpR family regulator
MCFNVWIVDDDPAMLAMLSSCAREAGWHYRTFTSVSEMMVALDAEMESPNVVVADWTLPDGPILSLRERTRAARWIIMSGDPLVQGELPEYVQWLAKPFRLLDFYRVVEAFED